MLKPTVLFQEADSPFLPFLRLLDHEISPIPFTWGNLMDLVFHDVHSGRMLALGLLS